MPPAIDPSAAATPTLSIPLDGRWVLCADEVAESGPDPAQLRDVPASVPGCVHTDLMRAGQLADPLVGMNEPEAHWIGHTSWRYRRTFEVDADHPIEHSRVELVCDGLDTACEVRLNDRTIGRAENMHMQHRFDIRGALRSGVNTIEISFEAPIPAARARSAAQGHMPHVGGGTNIAYPHNAIRKMACSYGWDWGPSLPSVGIWRPIRIEAWTEPRIRSVRPLVSFASRERADVNVFVDLELGDRRPSTVRPHITLRDPDGHVVASATVVPGADGIAIASVSVDRPRLWWPTGYGAQPLYSVSVSFAGAEPEWVGKIGLRQIGLLDTPEDGGGRGFAIAINGRTIFCKGANWIPDDVFPSRISREQIRQRVRQASDANMNMLRVWGGGLYESQDFYDVCDELGIMVWQDFLFACSAYSEAPEYRAAVEAEARQAIARLARHASLVLWCGNNECHVAIQRWGAFDELRESGRPWGAFYYHTLCPKLVAELDPSRPYWPGSPYSGEPERDAHDDDAGDQHLWEVWNGRRQGDAYLEHLPRFASEFGFHAPPTWATLARAIPADERDMESPSMVLHNKHKGGQSFAQEIILQRFDHPDDFSAMHYLAQVMQARALSLGCRWFRANWPYCTGALYWQLNDCWPVSSWAAIDGDGGLRPMWFETRRFFAPRTVSIVPSRRLERGEAPRDLVAYVSNDTDAEWRGALEISCRDVRTAELTADAHRVDVTVPARAVERVDVPASMVLSARTMLVAEMDGVRDTRFHDMDREIPLPEAHVDGSLEPVREGVSTLTLTARSVIRELCLLTDHADPTSSVSDQYLTLLPGDVVDLEITHATPLAVDTLLAPPVFRCTNQFSALR